MTRSKQIFTNAASQSMIESEREERQLALEYLAEAWNVAEEEGVESLALAHASLFAALATLVRNHGEEATAELVAALPDRIRSGEYNLERTLQ
ncbi:MAG TPA: hypothetical protein VGO70_05985 [Arsenicitalea sp.]|jgi:hypothetical protein|nr:hypothetical protein [Arsenicitalea sp.]